MRSLLEEVKSRRASLAEELETNQLGSKSTRGKHYILRMLVTDPRWTNFAAQEINLCTSKFPVENRRRSKRRHGDFGDFMCENVFAPS